MIRLARVTKVARVAKVTSMEMKMRVAMLTMVVSLAKNGVAPELPKTVWEEPPKAAPMDAPLPACNSTTKIRDRQATTWIMSTARDIFKPCWAF